MRIILLSLFFFCPLLYSSYDLSDYENAEYSLEEYRNVSIDYVKSKYEHTVDDIEYLWYPAQNPKQLVVLFGGAIRNLYSRWSWFWNDSEIWEHTSYLFLKDDHRTWYFGTHEKPLSHVYESIIKSTMESLHLTERDIIMIGNSMGGYAALRFGIMLGVRSILTICPQTEWLSACHFKGVKNLRGLWIDIEDLIAYAPYIPPVYLNYSLFGPDKKAGTQCLKALLARHSLVITEKTREICHNHGGPHKAHTLSIMTYMNALPSE